MFNYLWRFDVNRCPIRGSALSAGASRDRRSTPRSAEQAARQRQVPSAVGVPRVELGQPLSSSPVNFATSGGAQ